MPQAPPVQMALYQGRLTDKLDIDNAARHLANFLTSCKLEMQLAAQAVGRYSLQELDRSDLVTVEPDLAEFLNIRYAANSRREKQPQKQQPQQSRQPQEISNSLPLQ
jgi:hypothetical protein